MGLTQYQRKRDFTKTSEPKAKPVSARRRGGHSYVIQKHDASRLHYDFRLELDGTLKSWAVPKGPSLDPSQKRLAVEVEDHPLDYAAFEGTIPKGQYGGGTVMVWDVGEWTPLEDDPAEALRRGKLSFTLDGAKLHGAWTLTRLHGRGHDESKNNWLLIKRTDEFARRDGDALLETPSVKSGRTLEQIAGGRGKVWRSNRGGGDNGSPKSAIKARIAKAAAAATTKVKAPAKATKAAKISAKTKPRGTSAATRRRASSTARPAIEPGRLRNAVKARLPRDLAPQLCTLAESAPNGAEWIHEIKFDGYRLLAQRDGASTRLITRSGQDWTARFPPIADALAGLPIESAILDGEATILGDSGHTSFQRLQQAIKTQSFASLVFFVFDLPYLEGHDLRRAPLLERKELLVTVLENVASGVLRYSDHVTGDGPDVQRQACAMSLEGIVSKRVDAPYESGRTRTWLKIKCSRRQEFVIVGWTPPGGSRKHFGALLLGAHDDHGRLVYTGRVGTGFDERLLADLAARLRPIARASPPVEGALPSSETREARWVEPKLVGEVEFTEWTEDGRLRHPSFQGLREDKEASAVRIEKPKSLPSLERATRYGHALRSRDGSRSKVKATKAAKATKATKATAATSAAKRGAAGAPVVGGVTISSADRVVYPEDGLTKLDLARYHEAIADVMLPFVSERPLSTVRCPSGRGGQCFFQKHLGDTFSAPVYGIPVREKEKTEDWIAIDSKAGLISLVQFGVIEIHPWGAPADHLEQPDSLTFDLDPGPGVSFEALKIGAVRVRAALAATDLESFVKTSGGKGLHVCVPLKPRASWDEAKAFAMAIARKLAAEEPERYVANMSKAKRGGKIFVDYLRNSRGGTSVGAYSARARVTAPVSMPIEWKDLATLASAAQFTITTAPTHVAKRKRDPWTGYFGTRQQLTASRLRSVGTT